MKKSHGWLPALLSIVLVAGCSSLDVPDFNNGDLTDLQQNPTPGKVNSAAQGLLFGHRASIGARNGYVALLGILGREGYNFDAADPRFVTEMLVGPLDGGSPAFGGNLWTLPYRNIRAANIVLNALDIVVGYSAEEVAAVRGFARTIQALDYLVIINTRDTHGAARDVDIGATGDPAPIVGRTAMLDHIVQLLDDGNTDLGAAGTSAFPFALTTGFTGFNTPATFRTVNRAIRARVAVYRDDFTGALTALGGSFIDTLGTSLGAGAYNTYSTGSGDLTNGLFDPGSSDLLAHPSLAADAQLKGNGSPDDRFTSKVITLSDTVTVQNISTVYGFGIYNSLGASIPIVRHEELILLRAEANLGAGNVAAALDDINFIRVNSGGLAPIAGATWTGMTATQRLDELLYNKRYSLLWEGGHRWLDMRHYGRIGQLPLDVATHTRQTLFPFPVAECNARINSPPATGC